MQHTACLLLHIDDLELPSDIPYRARWQWHDPQGQSMAHESAPQTLNDIASNLPPAWKKTNPGIVVLLPGQSVLVTTAPMGKHARDLHKVSKAATYAVEDQLAEPAEEVHSAVGNTLSTQDSQVSVAVIRNAWMDKLVRELDTAGLSPDVVTSEAMLLPYESGKAFLFIDGEDVLFRFSNSVTSKLERDVFIVFLEHYLTQATSPLPAGLPAFQTLELWTAGDMRAPPAHIMGPLQALCRPHGIAVIHQHTENSTFDWLCQRWLNETYSTEPVNLMQGPYQRHSGSAFSNTKAMVVIIAAWFVLQVAFNAGSTMYFNNQAEQLHAQSLAIYRQLFPDDARIVDLRAQFMQHLAPANGSADNFMPLMATLASGMADAHHPDIQMLQFDAAKNELTADMIASDFTNLDAFKHLDADVEVGSAVKEENGIHGQVHIRGKSGKDTHG